MGKSAIIYCEKCGKKLLERKPNGIWHFKFGRVQGKDETIIDILFCGSLKFKCPRRSCGHVNVLNYFPDTLGGTNFRVDHPQCVGVI